MQKFIELFTQVIEFWILYLIIIVHFTGINRFEILFLLSINSSELIVLLPLIRGGGGNMGKKKYNEFYFMEDGKIHPDSDYWDLYNKDKNEAMKKLEGKMNCPLCFMAPLTVAKGRKLKYFKVNQSDVSKHLKNCPYLLDEATKSEVKEFYESAIDEDIKNRLTICMNKMLKKKIEETKNNELTVKEDNNEFKAFIIENRKRKRKYLPTISLYSQDIREELDKLKIYYGKCKVYYNYRTYIDENDKNKEIKRYYLQILNNKTNKLICSLSVSSTVFGYLEISLPDKRENSKLHYLRFFAEFYIKEEYLNAILKDSRMILFEEIENN